MTTKCDLMAIGIRIVSFYILVEEILRIPSLARSGSMFVILFKVVYALLAAALLFSAPEITKLILNKEKNETQLPLTAESLEVALISMLGLSLFLNSLPSLVYWFTYGREARSIFGGGGTALTAEGAASLYSAASKLLLGFLVFFKADGIQGLIKRSRSFKWIKE